MGWYGYGYFKRSTPRRAKGGIKAQGKRGKFGESWWAKRWIQTLESFNIGARLGRGRSYARSGQVLSINIKKGLITALVQGSRTQPYEVEIVLKPLSKQAWKNFAKTLNGQPYFAAKLMSGQMPDEIENIFKKAKLSLFPTQLSDLKTECSCPDWSNPCKHIAAVYYLIGEEFDRNPFLIFTLRGIEREELLSLVGTSTSSKQKSKVTAESMRKSAREQASISVQTTFPADPKVFWGNIDIHTDSMGEVSIPTFSAALPKQLGNFPFWRSEQKFIEALEPIYQNASSIGLEIVAGIFCSADD